MALLAPFAVVGWDVDGAAVPWIVASAALEAAYFFLLTAGYDRGDLSAVYPLVRGSAPVLVLAVSVAFLGAEPSARSSGSAGAALARKASATPERQSTSVPKTSKTSARTAMA